MLSFKIVVVSDQVYEGKKRDVSGSIAERIIVSRGYNVCGKTVIPNSYKEIVRAIRSSNRCDVFLFIGGTGASPRDITVDVVRSLAWRHIPGYGEYFRLRSVNRTGLHGILSRAELYVLGDGRIAVVLPGSPDAVELGLEILFGIVEHLVEEVKRYEGPHQKP